jgi:prepilin-type N-terminal cleavage/methylation domain-containing protein
MTTKLFSYRKGFTLLETLVAVLILTTAIAGPLSIASRSLHNSIIARDQITAFFLAQDAVEFVRFGRDTNKLEGADWITDSGGTLGVDLTNCTGGNTCYLDSTKNSPATPTVCSSACPVMNYDRTNSRFTYAAVGGNIVATPFTRQVVMTQVASTEYKIAVSVTWLDSGARSHTVTVTENILDWQ